VRVIVEESGEQLGVITVREALARAQELDLDLVEISPQAEPPVCKIMNYGKFRFQQQKRAAEARKNQQTINVKEITLRPRTEDHDYQVKMKKIREFLTRNDKVKITVRFRGRELANQQLGMSQLISIENDVIDIAHVESRPSMAGRMMSMMLAPGADKDKLKAREAAAKQDVADEAAAE
jgi:translation initiation factor IF-3